MPMRLWGFPLEVSFEYLYKVGYYVAHLLWIGGAAWGRWGGHCSSLLYGAARIAKHPRFKRFISCIYLFIDFFFSIQKRQ